MSTDPIDPRAFEIRGTVRRFPVSGRSIAFLFTSLVLAAMLGCGDGTKSVYKVRGQLFDSKKMPAVGALVTLHPISADPRDPARPTATVDEQGNFALTTYTSGDGAPAGDYTITITWIPPRKTPFEAIGTDQLAGKFDRPEKSPYKFTVEKKPDQEIPAIALP